MQAAGNVYGYVNPYANHIGQANQRRAELNSGEYMTRMYETQELQQATARLVIVETANTSLLSQVRELHKQLGTGQAVPSFPALEDLSNRPVNERIAALNGREMGLKNYNMALGAEICRLKSFADAVKQAEDIVKNAESQARKVRPLNVSNNGLGSVAHTRLSGDVQSVAGKALIGIGLANCIFGSTATSIGLVIVGMGLANS